MSVYTGLLLLFALSVQFCSSENENTILATVENAGKSQFGSSGSSKTYTDDNGVVRTYQESYTIEQTPEGKCLKRTVETINGESKETVTPLDCKVVIKELEAQKEKHERKIAKIQEDIRKAQEKLSKEFADFGDLFN